MGTAGLNGEVVGLFDHFIAMYQRVIQVVGFRIVDECILTDEVHTYPFVGLLGDDIAEWQVVVPKQFAVFIKSGDIRIDETVAGECLLWHAGVTAVIIIVAGVGVVVFWVENFRDEAELAVIVTGVANQQLQVQIAGFLDILFFCRFQVRIAVKSPALALSINFLSA